MDASCGDKNLTNRDLAFYYWQQYYTFVNNYGSYLSYIMDTSKGLDEQAYSEGQTWQQAFLDSAVTMFHSMTAINLEADKAGFELGEEDQAQLDAIPESLDATAGYYGMEDGLAYFAAGLRAERDGRGLCGVCARLDARFSVHGAACRADGVFRRGDQRLLGPACRGLRAESGSKRSTTR